VVVLGDPLGIGFRPAAVHEPTLVGRALALRAGLVLACPPAADYLLWYVLDGIGRLTLHGRHCGDSLGTRQTQLCLEQILILLWQDSIHPAPGPVDAVLDEITHVIRLDPSRRWTVAELAADGLQPVGQGIDVGLNARVRRVCFVNSPA
jgi:hypothetical protein